MSEAPEYMQADDSPEALLAAIASLGEQMAQLIVRVDYRFGKQLVAARALTDASARDMEITRLSYADPGNWIRVANQDFQTGLMALRRAVQQPTGY